MKLIVTLDVRTFEDVIIDIDREDLAVWLGGNGHNIEEGVDTYQLKEYLLAGDPYEEVFPFSNIDHPHAIYEIDTVEVAE